MFGMSVYELAFVGVIALLVFGPEKLPEMARNAGKVAGELKKHSDSLRKEFYNTVYPPVHEVKDEIKKQLSLDTMKIEETCESAKTESTDEVKDSDTPEETIDDNK